MCDIGATLVDLEADCRSPLKLCGLDGPTLYESSLPEGGRDEVDWLLPVVREDAAVGVSAGCRRCGRRSGVRRHSASPEFRLW